MLFYSIFVPVCIYFSYQDLVYGEIKRIYLYAAIAVVLCAKAPAAAWECFGGAALGILLFLLVYIKTGRGYGWPAKNGDVWVPDAHAEGSHSPHWDVQHPDGTYHTVYPISSNTPCSTK